MVQTIINEKSPNHKIIVMNMDNPNHLTQNVISIRENMAENFNIQLGFLPPSSDDRGMLYPLFKLLQSSPSGSALSLMDLKANIEKMISKINGETLQLCMNETEEIIMKDLGKKKIA